jgi:hypothetical protein
MADPIHDQWLDIHAYDGLNTNKKEWGAMMGESECEHKHWYKDEDSQGRQIRICEDCGDSIRESEVKKEFNET